MNVTLNIQKDDELRKHVKELISGQVKSVVREEIKSIVTDLLSKKIRDTETPNINHIFSEEIRKQVLKEMPESTYSNDGFIRTEAKKLINKKINEVFSSKQVIK